jgi:hypothetical protein
MVRVRNFSPQVQRQLQNNIKDALNAVGLFVEGEAKRKTPVDKGALINSFDHDIDVKKGMVRIGNFQKYAVDVCRPS